MAARHKLVLLITGDIAVEFRGHLGDTTRANYKKLSAAARSGGGVGEQRHGAHLLRYFVEEGSDRHARCRHHRVHGAHLHVRVAQEDDLVVREEQCSTSLSDQHDVLVRRRAEQAHRVCVEHVNARVERVQHAQALLLDAAANGRRLTIDGRR